MRPRAEVDTDYSTTETHLSLDVSTVMFSFVLVLASGSGFEASSFAGSGFEVSSQPLAGEEDSSASESGFEAS